MAKPNFILLRGTKKQPCHEVYESILQLFYPSIKLCADVIHVEKNAALGSVLEDTPLCKPSDFGIFWPF